MDWKRPVEPPADVATASRTILELVATLMQGAFDTLGEGVILGTMPGYLRRFGLESIRTMAASMPDCHAEGGAVEALTGINHISRCTGTRFDMVEARKDRAVKRLHDCEFIEAFQNKGTFPKTMICLLHQAAYEGYVNGLVQDPTKGYDVTVESRILFGAPFCDFVVTARHDLPHEPDQECRVEGLDAPDGLGARGYDFYVSILTSFVHYLTRVLDEEQVHALLDHAAWKVGRKLQRLRTAMPDAPGPGAAGAKALVADLLRRGGRIVSEAEDGRLEVPVCFLAAPIMRTAAQGETPRMDVRRNACRLCLGVLQGAADAHAGQQVTRETCMTLTDDACTFRVGETP